MSSLILVVSKYSLYNYCFTENRELRTSNKRLRDELVEWQKKYSNLKKEREEANSEIHRLQAEMRCLMEINQHFGDENERLQREVSSTNKASIGEGPKRQKIDNKAKRSGKKPILHEAGTDSDADEATTEPDEKGARVSKFW